MAQQLLRRPNPQAETGFECPLCGLLVDTAPYQFSSEGQESLIYLCQDCDFLFGRPVFIPDQQQRQMDSISDAELYDSGALKFLHRKLILKREVRAVRSILGSGVHRVLDIGCGTGWTSAFWRDNGFDVTGLEPSPSRRAVAQERYGLSVIGDYLEDAKIDQVYDLVILRHIIEHFASPRDLLEKAASLVAPGGLVLIVVPNIRCLGRYFFDTYWTWVFPWHCNFFSPRSVGMLAKAASLRQIHVWQTSSPMYYHESFQRRFPYVPIKKVFNLFGPIGMLCFSPLAITATVFGLGDNLSLLASKDGISEQT